MPAPREDSARVSWMKRIGWLIVFWILGVAVLGVVAGLLRLLMNAAGLTA
ncbi:MAG: DUF2474 domain-containing protein [Pseudomonadota bacterium]|jgi:hypothetical protein|nr:DUF2474 domain-containing protein [Pseudomonadota bacterium]